MLCEFVGGPENGQRDEVGDICNAAYCTGLSRELVDWYERDPANPARFLHCGQITMAEYLARTKSKDPPGFGSNQGPIPDWVDKESLPEWARE